VTLRERSGADAIPGRIAKESQAAPVSESQPSLPITAAWVERAIEPPNSSPGFSSSGHASSHPFQFVPERSKV